MMLCWRRGNNVCQLKEATPSESHCCTGPPAGVRCLSFFLMVPAETHHPYLFLRLLSPPLLLQPLCFITRCMTLKGL